MKKFKLPIICMCICITAIAIFAVVLKNAPTEKKFVCVDDPEDYYIINEDNYTRYYKLHVLKDEDYDVETGTVTVNEDDHSISFVQSGKTTSRDYYYDGKFFGTPMFEVPNEQVFNNGTSFEIEDASFRVWFGRLTVTMLSDGSYVMMGPYNIAGDMFVEKGTYEVKHNIVTLTGTYEMYDKDDGRRRLTEQSERKWYYNEGSLYGTFYWPAYVK